MKRAKSHGQRLRKLRGGGDAEYDRHRRLRDPALAEAKRIRSGRRWRDRTREAQLRREPLCEDCKEAGRVTVATQVDHVIPLRRRPDLAYTWENLRSLCVTCHARKSAQERCVQ